MKLQLLITRILLVCCVATAYGWSDRANAQPAPKLPKGLKAVASQYASSYILGTGESRFLTSVNTIDAANAVAIIGSNGDFGWEPDSYTAYLKRIDGKWKVVRFEFISRDTGKKVSKDQIPPFPYPGWERNAP